MKGSKKTVWVNGCFDVLHLGHIRLLKYARSLGDELVVGLDSDAKIKKDKGLSRRIVTGKHPFTQTVFLLPFIF